MLKKFDRKLFRVGEGADEEYIKILTLSRFFSLGEIVMDLGFL
jgi:hypothetical protein